MLWHYGALLQNAVAKGAYFTASFPVETNYIRERWNERIEEHSDGSANQRWPHQARHSRTLIRTSAPFVRISGTYIAWPRTGRA
jgi:hypothetical protein